MKLSITAASDIGAVRTNNEDMILVDDQLVRDGQLDVNIDTGDRSLLIAVSDGMGGHAAGELASEFTLQRMRAAVADLPRDIDSSSLQGMLDERIKEVHQSLNQLGKDNPELRGLGCTFTGLLLYYNKLFSIHVGDSRLYRIRLGVMALLSRDHSLRNMLNDPSIPANQIANSFGGGASSIFFDFEELTERVLPNDKLLLCSDGLNGELTDEEIEEALETGADSSNLAKMAREKGGRDNISCVVISIK